MAKDQDQSMEEILQSIKRIIAEEGEPAPSGSDVLELTELLSDEDPNASKSQGPQVGSLSIDEIMAAPVEPEFEPTPPPAAKPEPVVRQQATPAEEEPLVSEKTLASSAAALEALKQVPQPQQQAMPSSGLGFRSGTTIEDLVLEALRPMLKEWLDEHLTKIVERLVEKEVRRLSAFNRPF